MNGDQGLVIRRSARYDVVIPARVSIAPVHAGLVKLSASSGAREGWLDVDVVDFSAGGVGVLSTVFIPRGCTLSIELLSPGTTEVGEIKLLEVLVKVQRVVMTDRRPAYLIGTAFETPSPETLARIDALLKRMEGAAVA